MHLGLWALWNAHSEVPWAMLKISQTEFSTLEVFSLVGCLGGYFGTTRALSAVESTSTVVSVLQ